MSLVAKIVNFVAKAINLEAKTFEFNSKNKMSLLAKFYIEFGSKNNKSGRKKQLVQL